MDNADDTRRIVLTMAKLSLPLITSILTDCATLETHQLAPAGDALTTCRMLYQEADAAIKHAGVIDYGSSPIRDFPYLHTTQKHWTA